MGAAALMRNRFVTPELVEEVMGVASGALGSIGWLVIQEEAAGASHKVIAAALDVSEDDLVSLRDNVTGKTGEESAAMWLQGVVCVKAGLRMNQVAVGAGWDAVESMAVEKLAIALSQMATNGDPMQMLTIAKEANKAIRRRDGEGRSGGGTQVHVNAIGADVGMELKSGNLGTLKLNIAPRVRAQLANPDRVIDGVVNRSELKTTNDKVSMLGIKDVRKLTMTEKEIHAAEKEKPKDFASLIAESGL